MLNRGSDALRLVDLRLRLAHTNTSQAEDQTKPGIQLRGSKALKQRYVILSLMDGQRFLQACVALLEEPVRGR